MYAMVKIKGKLGLHGGKIQNSSAESLILFGFSFEQEI